MADSVRSPIPHTCVSCKRQLGISVGIIPHYIHDGGGATKWGEGKLEAWCPTCFVFVRAHRETMEHGGPRHAPHWHDDPSLTQGMMRAIKCLSCGNESLAHGHTGCLQCPPPPFGVRKRDNFIVLRDPHFTAILAGAKDPVAGARDVLAGKA